MTQAITRRAALALSAAAALPAAAIAQQEETFEAAERAILAGRRPRADGITIDMEGLSENGNSVDIALSVDSPTTAEDHVTAIHILAEKNPVARVARFGLTPRAGQAVVATRIRLATTQTILVLAETSRGEVHRAAQEVIVILGACVEGG
jgi:sulfur-oxidizing protein SoxY